MANVHLWPRRTSGYGDLDSGPSHDLRITGQNPLSRHAKAFKDGP